MKKISKKSAFYLAELAIVILIIGILIVGIVFGSKMIRSFRLNSARTLTESSPVASIKNLVAWYETTSSKSFIDSEAVDGASISTWYDINPQLMQRNNGSQSTSGYRPLYKIDGLAGLPMAYFDGSDDGIDLPDGTIPNGDSSFTIFVAAKPLLNSATDKTFISTKDLDTGTTNHAFIFYRSNANVRAQVGANAAAGGTINPDRIYIFSASYSNGYSNTSSSSRKAAMYVNGARSVSETSISSALTITTVNNAIGIKKHNSGRRDALYGYIGEVILFDRYLSVEERQSIESYLGQKWGVAVAKGGA